MLTVCFWISMLHGCLTPCEELANKICACEDSFATETACRQLVTFDAKNVKNNDASSTFCKSKLKECNCDELIKGNRGACGLTLE